MAKLQSVCVYLAKVKVYVNYIAYVFSVGTCSSSVKAKRRRQQQLHKAGEVNTVSMARDRIYFASELSG